MTWLKRTPPIDHVCRLPSPFRPFFATPRYGTGTVWMCEWCQQVWIFNANAEWVKGEIDHKKLPPSPILPPPS